MWRGSAFRRCIVCRAPRDLQAKSMDKKRSNPGLISKPFDIDGAPWKWGPDELGDILRHQMQAPLAADLNLHTLRRHNDEMTTLFSPDPCMGTTTFGRLFNDKNPPLNLLRLCKEFARENRFSKGGALPDEVAAVLYYAAIVVALRRTGARITSLTREEVQSGIEWIRTQDWIDPETRSIFQTTPSSHEFFRDGGDSDEQR